MNFIDWIKNKLGIVRTINTGLLLDSPKFIEALPRHELFAGGGGMVTDWKSLCPPFRYQGASVWCTAFAGTAIGYCFEKKEQGSSPIFSAMELFYRSGGSLNGNYLIKTADEMEKTLVLETEVPTPIPDGWDINRFQTYKAASYASAQELSEGQKYALKSAASVNTDKVSLRSALVSSPLMVAIPIGRGYWENPAPNPPTNTINAYHAVVLVDIDAQGNYVIFDSLTNRQGFDGFHLLASDYPILYALSFIDLPDNWKDIQQEQNEITHFGALDHYGEKRNFALEVRAANDLTLAAKKNPTLATLIGRQFTVYVNAVSYGNYSLQDILNSATSVRRGQGPIFNFDLKRT